MRYLMLPRERKPAELLLVPMIDIFTVLVTFLLMTAVFSRTVILQLNLPPPNTTWKEPPPGLQLEVMVRKDLIQVADRNTGPLATFPNIASGYDYDDLTEDLKRVKARFPDKATPEAVPGAPAAPARPVAAAPVARAGGGRS